MTLGRLVVVTEAIANGERRFILLVVYLHGIANSNRGVGPVHYGGTHAPEIL